MQSIYDLRTDDERLAILQAASLKPDGTGLSPAPALVGSTEWWCLVDEGTLPTYEFVGCLSRAYENEIDNWPMFTLNGPDGSARSWTREGSRKAYRPGRRMAVRWVTLPLRERGAQMLREPTLDLTLEILGE